MPSRKTPKRPFRYTGKKERRPLRTAKEVNWRPRADLAAERERARLARQEEDRLELICAMVADEMSFKQIARKLALTLDYVERLFRLRYPNKDEFAKYSWLARFEQNRIDPYKFGHC